MKNILVLLADIANGVFAVFLAGFVTQNEVAWWYFPIGIVLAILPDLDAVPELLRRGKISASAEHLSDHRDYLHFPIIYIVTGGTLVLIFGFWGWVFFFAVIFHFINDLYGTGWGIPVFWPLTRKRYKVLGRRANRLKGLLIEDEDWDSLPRSERQLRLLVSWDMDELPTYIKRWGVDDWIDKWYLQINWVSGTEYLLFALACALIVTQLL